jgi:predicted lipoprotein
MLHQTPLVLLLALLCACGGGGTGAAHAGPRRQMLQDVALMVVVPTYDTLVTRAAALADTLQALEAQPDAATLAPARDAWRAARAAWQQSEAFAFGPAATLRSASKLDWSPIRADRIETAIAGASAFDSAAIENLGANVKGFLALEYLLFDADGDDDAVLAALNGHPRRRAYVRALGENLRDQSMLLRDAWSPADGNFAGELATAGQGSLAYKSVKAAVDALVNQMIFLSDDIAVRQLRNPLGASGEPRPDLIVAARSGNGLADLLDGVVGIQNTYLGTYAGRGGASLSIVVRDLSPTADTAITLAVERVLDSAARLTVPLEEAVDVERPAVERTQSRASDLMRRLEIDMVSVLGTTLRFNPNDGD